MEERPYSIPNQFPGIVLAEATEGDRTWYIAALRCPASGCQVLLVREHRFPVSAETVLLQAMEEHLQLAHGLKGTAKNLLGKWWHSSGR